jgi:magnesium transporter
LCPFLCTAEAKKGDNKVENEVLTEQNYVEELVGLIRSETSNKKLLERLDQYHENDIAGAFEQLNQDERRRMYRILSSEQLSEIFAYIEDAGDYITEMSAEKAAEVIGNMDSDEAVDVLEDMDEKAQEKLVSLLDEESSADIRLIQSYDEDEIGSRMTTNFIEIKRSLSVKQAMKSLVDQAEDNDNISILYVTNEDGSFYGAMDLKDLIIARKSVDLDSLISTSFPYVRDHEQISDCLERIKDYAEDSIPVLDENNQILGVITAQDIVEVVDAEMGEDYAKLAGLIAEEDIKEPLRESIKKRIPWLFALLLLGMVVSSIVGIFESVVQSVAIIVCFQSLILDMAGNVGTQSLAVTIRVLMDEQLKAGQKIMLVLKEMRVGLCNGALLGGLAFVFVGLYIFLLKGYPAGMSFVISGCVGLALLIAMVIASLVGTVVPMFFHKLGVDPAVASGPLITTVNDMVAVITYYGLAWILLVKAVHVA